jgi:hypothetical protein
MFQKTSQFIATEKFLSQDNALSFTENLIIKSHFWLKETSHSEERSFSLKTSNVIIEIFFDSCTDYYN